MGVVFGRINEEIQPYTLLEKKNGYEIRAYPRFRTAEVISDDLPQRIINVLYHYAHGWNTKTREEDEPPTPSESLFGNLQKVNTICSIYSPVRMYPGKEGFWRVVLLIEKKDAIPTPIDDRVTIRSDPDMIVATKRFSGSMAEENFWKKYNELIESIKRDDIKVKRDGMPFFAVYNYPWCLPFLRRNEVNVILQGDENKK